MSNTDGFERLERLNAENLLAGGAERLAKRKERGLLNARERVEFIVDPNSFVEMDRYARHDCRDFGIEGKRPLGDGVICGSATIDGRTVFLFSQDATVFGGSLSNRNAKKICKVMDQALKVGAPVVGLNDSGGARIQEGVRSLAGYADIFLRNTLVSGVIPQISGVLGPCAGGAVYSPAITDFIFMVEKSSYMFVTGPDVISTVTHEKIDKERLGGAYTHNSQSGVAHFSMASEHDLLNGIRHLLSYLPSNNQQLPPRLSFDSADFPKRPLSNDKLDSLVPSDASKPYDISTLIRWLSDDLSYFEVQADFAQNISVGFIRIGGMPIGVVANQPQILAGCLDIDASDKGARFVRFCDAFNIPLLTLVDVPGFLPGVHQEHGGIIRHGAKLLFAFAEATVPKITVITRKAYGGAYDVMASKHIRADYNIAFPDAEIAVMGPEGAVNIIFREELAGLSESKAAQRRKELITEYRSKFANPYVAAELGYIDEVIVPHQLRNRLIDQFTKLWGKRDTMPPKKHGNIPL